jgi:hypothetical protein
MGAFFGFLLIILIVAWAVFVQIGARQQVDVATKMTEQDAGEVVRNYFGALWSQVDGPGHVNYRPRLRAYAPVISISFSPDGTRECGVSIWTSSWKTRYGLMVHAQLVWRKKMALCGRLRSASEVDSNWTRGA